MFLKQKEVSALDLSVELRDPADWKVGVLRTLDHPLNITALASEPISGLLAVGTADGDIYIFGAPGVEAKLKLSEPLGVKFLQFASQPYQLLCLDDTSMLYIWTLLPYGQPKLLISVRFDQTNALTVSPSHNHVFLALNSGEIRTYDLVCLRKSPYIMPNMWKLYEDKMSASGVPVTSGTGSGRLVDVVAHPRNLSNLFVAYGGGVVLADLAKRDTSRAYELIIPPGAPGSSGYGTPDVMTQRTPEVTAISIHPSGHFFAVGYGDGSMAFWAVDDEDNPLLVRTLDALNINIVDPEGLEQHLAPMKGTQQPVKRVEREPIFKLTWSGYCDSTDPRGGKTTLVILGGLNVGDAAGATVIQLPAFNPPDPQSPLPPNAQYLHPFIRNAMRESLDPLESYFYQSQGVVQDYVLVPRESPHFSGSFDPLAIMLLVEGAGNTRHIQAFEFPPPDFSLGSENPKQTEEVEKDTVESLSDTLASTLQALEEMSEPGLLALPMTLMNGGAGLQQGQLLKVERDTYKTLTGDVDRKYPALPLKGGLAWSDDSKANNLKLAKHQPHRILITQSRDLTVRFYDASAQLLIGLPPNPLQHSFPNPLLDLTIELKPVLADPLLTQRIPQPILKNAEIDAVYFSTEALETLIVLKSGEVIVYRLSGPRQPGQPQKTSDKELIPLDHIPSNSGFSAYFMVACGFGPVEACAVSDVGFLAVAYQTIMYVIDLRGPRVIFRHVDDKSSKGRPVVGLHPGRSEPDPITSLVWTISPLAKDPQSRIRLIAMHTSGRYEIFTVAQSSSTWTFHGPISAEGGISHPVPRGSFVIDSKSGRGWTADKARLSAAMSEVPSGVAPTPGILVTVGAKGAKCISGINGQRLGKAEWGSKVGAVQTAQIVEKMGSHVLVVVTDRHEALLYSLPQLEHLQNLKLPTPPFSLLALDESGDFIAWTAHSPSRIMHQATYGTLFNVRRAYEPPDIDLACTKPVVPPQPQPVSMGPSSIFQLGSWLSFSQPMTGAQLDDLLGGPDRPVPKPEAQSWNLSDSSNLGASVSGVAAAAASAQSALYDRLTSAVNERGQMLDDLGERFNALEQGSKEMVAQAKRIATQQGAKAWLFGL